MKKTITIVLIFIFSQAHTQNIFLIDSLKRILAEAERNEEKVTLYGKISWEYLSTRNHIDIGELYADSIRMLAEKLNDEKGHASANYLFGAAARHKGEFAKALELLNKSVTYYEKSGDSTRVAYTLFQIAAIHSTMGNFDKSLAILYRALNIHESDGSHFDIGYVLNGIGVTYRNMKKYDNALNIYQRALELYETIDAPGNKADVLVNMANIYTDLHRFEEAKYYYKQALIIDKALGSDWGVAYDLENIGHVYNELQQNDSALIYHLQALEIREKMPQKNEIAISNNKVGYTYFLLKDFSKAEEYMQKALSLANETQSKLLLREIYKAFSQLYAEEKKYKEAYEAHRLFMAMKDSVMNEQTSRQLNELQTKYETAEKDKQIGLLAKENELQLKEAERQNTLRKTYFGGFILMCMIALLVAYLFHQRLKNQKLLVAKNDEVKDARFKQRLGELEMKALRAQINPHFLFNCMNSINRMILNNETENASRYLTKFSKLVRLILENSESEQVPLSSELTMLEAYIQLEELRFKESIHYSIHIDEHLDPENTFLPPMILQPFVENAIWHGLMHRDKPEEGRIHIQIKEKEERLWCTVEDNGVGREKAMLLREKSVLKSKSMGLKITEERLKLLSSEKLQELILITDLKDSNKMAVGTRVDINIPVS